MINPRIICCENALVFKDHIILKTNLGRSLKRSFLLNVFFKNQGLILYFLYKKYVHLLHVFSLKSTVILCLVLCQKISEYNAKLIFSPFFYQVLISCRCEKTQRILIKKSFAFYARSTIRSAALQYKA